MNDEILEYQNFVQEKLDYIEKQSNLITNNQITPQLLNTSLANYNSINTFLINLYETSVLEDEILKDEYKLLYSEWFINTRQKLNESRVSSKFASSTEIEAQALVDNRDKYLEYKRKLNLSERKVSLYRRILDGWKIQAQMLINISNNMRSELQALSIENRANADLNKEKIIRHVDKPMKKKLHD